MQSKTDEIYMRLKEELLRLRFRRDEIINEKKLAEQYDVSKTPVREALGMLVQEGYLVREADPADRRRTLLRCTEKAQPIIVRGRALQEEFGQKLLENTTEAQRKAFCETMDIMNKNLDAILERDT